MYVSPLQPISNAQVYVSGDVTIEEGVAIAPGAILQADPDSRITLAPGVCIGMGVILHARQGTLNVEAGAVLGAGVLIVGSGNIGQNACIGSGTTLLNPSIQQQQVLPAGSLVGDASRLVADVPEDSTRLEVTPEPSPPPEELPQPSSIAEDPATEPVTESVTEPVTESVTESVTEPVAEFTSATATDSVSLTDTPTLLYGQAHINRLLMTLFPHRTSFDSNNPNGQSPSQNSE